MKKKIIYIVVAVLMLSLTFSLTACTAEKVFEKSGIKITATSEFYEKDILSMTIYLESRDKIITGVKETPNASFPISRTLRQYTELVLNTNNMNGLEISVYDEDGITFEYFEYEKEVSGKNFKYLGVTMKSDSYFYLFNFASENSKFEGFKSQFMDWAKLIEIE